jgi:hypothetical protein
VVGVVAGQVMELAAAEQVGLELEQDWQLQQGQTTQ